MSPTTNRLTSAGYVYDEAGNLLCDAAHQCASGGATSVASNLTMNRAYFDYDGENRMVRAGSGGRGYGDGGSSYTYDGDGRRVRKAVTGGEVTVFVHDALGRTVAEYSNQVQSNGTRYLTQDHLGSTRAVTGQDQSVRARHDYFPFGGELFAGAGGRATAQGYDAADNVRQKFTGYERDEETNLDYAQARYYANVQGRFTGPDPLISSGRPPIPQSWNRYTYVLNNPLLLSDPSGLDWAIRHVGEGDNRQAEFVYYTGNLTDEQRAQGFTPYTERWYFATEGAVYLGTRGATDYAIIRKEIFDNEAIGAPGYGSVRGATPGNFNDYEKEVLFAALTYVKPAVGACDTCKDMLTTLGLSTAAGEAYKRPSSAGGAAAGSASNDVIVIGNRNYTANYEGMPGTFVYTVPNQRFTLAGNDAMIAEGIARRATFQLANPPTNGFLFNSAGRQTVFGREYNQVKAAGYTCFGCFMAPPPFRF